MPRHMREQRQFCMEPSRTPLRGGFGRTTPDTVAAFPNLSTKDGWAPGLLQGVPVSESKKEKKGRPERPSALTTLSHSRGGVAGSGSFDPPETAPEKRTEVRDPERMRSRGGIGGGNTPASAFPVKQSGARFLSQPLSQESPAALAGGRRRGERRLETAFFLSPLDRCVEIQKGASSET